MSENQIYRVVPKPLQKVLPLVEQKPKQLANPFRWRDRHGQFHDLHKMETRHLHYTLRMIWNNFMSIDAQFPNANLYEFNAFYTDEYFKQAIVNLAKELSTRNNLTAQWKRELQAMQDYLQKHNLNEIKRLT